MKGYKYVCCYPHLVRVFPLMCPKYFHSSVGGANVKGHKRQTSVDIGMLRNVPLFYLKLNCTVIHFIDQIIMFIVVKLKCV